VKPPRPISFDDDGADKIPSVPSSPHRPKPISFSDESVQGAQKKNPRAISFADDASSPPKIAHRTPSSITDTSSIAGRLVLLALEEDETLKSKAMRLKPRFDALLQMKSDDILNWGENNAATLRTVTAQHKDIAVHLNSLEADRWIKKIVDESSKPPTMWGKLFGDSPQELEAKVQHIRDEIFQIIRRHSELHDEISPRSEDLRMDIVALTVLTKEAAHLFDANTVNSRLRTLIVVQQTVQMATISLENSKDMCLQHITAIDQLLQVTIPNWRIAVSKAN
jgi:hypothetical protein